MNFAKFCKNHVNSLEGFCLFRGTADTQASLQLLRLPDIACACVGLRTYIFVGACDYDPTITVLAEAHDTKITHAPEALLSAATPRTLKHSSTHRHTIAF